MHTFGDETHCPALELSLSPITLIVLNGLVTLCSASSGSLLEERPACCDGGEMLA